MSGKTGGWAGRPGNEKPAASEAKSKPALVCPWAMTALSTGMSAAGRSAPAAGVKSAGLMVRNTRSPAALALAVIVPLLDEAVKNCTANVSSSARSCCSSAAAAFARAGSGVFGPDIVASYVVSSA